MFIVSFTTLHTSSSLCHDLEHLLRRKEGLTDPRKGCAPPSDFFKQINQTNLINSWYLLPKLRSFNRNIKNKVALLRTFHFRQFHSNSKPQLKKAITLAEIYIVKIKYSFYIYKSLLYSDIKVEKLVVAYSLDPSNTLFRFMKPLI